MNAQTARKLHDGFASLIAGPAVWFVFFLLAYGVTGTGCELLAPGQGATNIRLLVVALAGLAILLIAFLGARNVIRFRQASERHGEDAKRQRFVDLSGAALCAASIIGVIWLTTGALIHPLC